MVIIELDIKASKVALMISFDVGDLCFRRQAILLGFQHDGRTMGIIGTDIAAVVTARALETHPNIGLNVFHQMA